MKKNEHGRVIAIGVEEDISLATYFELHLDPPDRELSDLVIYEIDGLEKSIVDLLGEDDIILLAANTYFTYTTKRGDILLSGQWRARMYVEFDNGQRGLFSKWQEFIVEE